VSSKQHGYTLAELLIVVAIIGMTVGVATPAFNSLRRRSAVRAAAAEIHSVFYIARMRAASRGRNSGIRFMKSGNEWLYAEYSDGDGDGLRSDDIAAGIDRPLFTPRRVLFMDHGAATIGVVSKTIPDPDGDKLTPTSSPVQFGRSQICSFSPIGESTSGTIYLIDGLGGIYAVRVYGASAKIRTLRFNGRKWEQL
jgi:prepilin-type N-terminal cleavage/methylation domain-containing protein